MSTIISHSSEKAQQSQKDFQDSAVQNFADELKAIADQGGKFCRIKWGEKRPNGGNWQANPLSLGAINLKACGAGLLLGHGGLLALDIDNQAGADRFQGFFGVAPHEYPSVSWSSGKKFSGDFDPAIGANSNIQILFKLTDAQASQIKGRKAFKNNTLDLRWLGSQSVLPTRSPHPGTGQPYRWHHAPSQFPIATMPDEVWQRIIADLYGSPKGAATEVEVNAESLASPLIQWMQNNVFAKLGIGAWDCFEHGFSEDRSKWRGVSHREGATNPTSFMIAKESPWIAHDFGDSQTWTIYRYYNFFKFGDATPPKGDRFTKICQLLAGKAMLAIPANLIGDDQSHRAWQKFNTFTPDQVIDAGGGYLSDVVGVPEPGEAIAIRGNMAIGKSHYLRKVDRALREEKVDYPTYRNSLGYQQHQNSDRTKATSAIHVGDDEFLRYQEAGFFERLHGWGCVHSAPQKSDEFLTDCNQVWDEFSGIINCLITDPNFRDFVEVWDKIIFGLAHCNRFIGTDANATNAAIDFLEKVSRRKITKLYVKRDKNTLRKVYRLVCTFKLNDFGASKVTINEKDFTPLLADMLTYLRANSGAKIAISSDSQLHCETVDNRLKKLGFKTLRIDSTTNGQVDVERFKHDPSWFKDSDYRVLIFSPTLESGVDCWCPFVAHFDFDFGICGAGATKQRLGRCRAAEITIQWQNPFPLRPDELLADPANVARFLAQKEAIINSWHDDPEIGQFRSEIFDKYRAFIDYGCQFLAAKNWERWHPREALKELLEMDGIEVHDYFEESGFEQEKKDYKESKEEVKDFRAKATFEARDLCPSEARTIANANAAKFEDQCALQKHQIKQAFPGIENSKFWSCDTVKTLLFKREIRNQAKLAYLMDAENVAIFKPLDAARGRYARPWDWKSQLLRAKFLRDAGLAEFLRDEDPFAASDPRITALIEVVKNNAPIFNLALPKKDAIKAVNKILKLVGARAKATGDRPKTDEGILSRSYTIVPLHDPALFADLARRSGQHFETRLAKLQESLETPTQQPIDTRSTFESTYIPNSKSGSTANASAGDIYAASDSVSDKNCGVREKTTQTPTQQPIDTRSTFAPTYIPNSKSGSGVHDKKAVVVEVFDRTPHSDTENDAELDMWGMVWESIARDCFTEVWQAVKAMGDRWAVKVFDELPDLVKAIDPAFAAAYAF